MKLPFTIEQFLETFRQYNVGVWPVQILLNILALVAIYFSIKKTAWSDKFIASILSFLWLWMGIVYHLAYFSKINKAAILFGALFILQSLLFIYFGVINTKLQFRLKMNLYGIAGIILILFALLVYPLIGFWLGHKYPSSPSFGLPCPTTIYTFGILLLSSKRLWIPVVLIPFLWSLIGFSAAFKLGMKEDISLLLAGMGSMILIVMLNRSLRRQHA